MKLFCPTCGYANEASLGTSLTCKSCGATFTVPAAVPPPAAIIERPAAAPPPVDFLQRAPVPWHPAAIASLVLGVLCCLPFAGIGSVISGAIALKAIRDSNGSYRGKELAIAGMALGGTSIALTVIAVIAQALTHR